MGISTDRLVVQCFTAAIVIGSVALSGVAMDASKSATHAQASTRPIEDRYAQYPAPPGNPPSPPPPGYYPPPSPPPCPAVTPTPLRGAARGAAGGAMFGAIAGDAGKGAAIGATVGGVGSAARRGSARRAGACY